MAKKNKRRLHKRILLVAFVLASISALEPTGLAQIEGAAAIVAPRRTSVETIILLSDVDRRARLHLAGRREGPVHGGLLPNALLQATLDELLAETLLSIEAERRNLVATDADLRRALSTLKSGAGGDERFAEVLVSIGASESEMADVIRRRALADVLLRERLRRGAGVSQSQLESIYEAGEHPFIGLPFEEVREPLRVWAEQQAVASIVAGWIESLSRRVEIRVYANYVE